MNELKVEGKVFKILEKFTGESANGKWEKQEFVIDTGGQFPKKICFYCWGDKTAMIQNLKEGQNVSVSFNPQSRGYNERWFTDLQAWKIENQSAVENYKQKSTDLPPPPMETEPEPEDVKDMPF